jgi:hypothetical protein
VRRVLSENQQTPNQVRSKFEADLGAARAGDDPEGFIFVTNQELRLAEWSAFRELWPGPVSAELYHLERVAAILDRPELSGIRRQFLGITPDSNGRGGQGGGSTIVGNRGVVRGGRGAAVE